MRDDARRMAQEIADLKKAVRDLQTSTRLGYTAIDGGALLVKDESGVVRQRIGRQTDGAYAVVDTNGITPPMPAPPILIAGPISVTIASYGNTVDNHDWPYDFEAIEVHVSTSQAFTPSPATKVGEFTTGGGSQIVRGEADVPLYAVLVGRNTSGLLGVPSEEVSATPLAIVTDADLASIEDSVTGLTERIDGTDADIATINAVTDAVKFDLTSVSERVGTTEGGIEDIVAIQLPGKNKVSYSTTQPGTNANTAGDTWFVFLNGEVVEVWQGEGGTTWTQLTIGGATLTNLDAGTITAGVLAAARIAAGTIDTGHLAAGAVQTAQLGALAVTADKIAANAITVGKIAAGAVDTGSLAADAITGMTITGGTITGATVIGGVLKTSTTGSRVEVLPVAGSGEVHFYSDATPDMPSQITGDGANDALNCFESLQLTPGTPAGGTGGVDAGIYVQHHAPVGGGTMTGKIQLIASEVQVTSGEFGMSQMLEDTWWTNATLVNGWVNYGGGFTVARYRRFNGVVYLEGLVRSGTGTIFTLPPGFRTFGGSLLFGTVDGTNTANARVDVDTAGNVSLVGGNNGFVSLAGISFLADA